MWDSVILWDFQIFEIWLAFCFVLCVDPRRHEVHRYEAMKAVA